jgi:hypothetical protein
MKRNGTELEKLLLASTIFYKAKRRERNFEWLAIAVALFSALYLAIR